MLVLPVLLVFGLFSWWPILQGVLLSLQETNFIVTDWVGLENFETVLTDPLLGRALQNTAYFAVLALVIGFPVPLVLATIIGEMRRIRRLASVLAFLPVMVPPVVGILLWKVFYRPSEDGLINAVLGLVGLGPFPFLQDASSAMPAIVVQATWIGFGSTTIIYLAAITAIDTQLYEAAELDGANPVRRFWHVTLPQLRGTILLLLLLQIIGTFQVFAEPYLMTGGGPNNATISLLMLIFNYAFVRGDYGGAAALSVMLAIGLGVISLIYFRLTRRWNTK
ncbi:MAG: sugar ABC transporter permease [Microbacterium sp.]